MKKIITFLRHLEVIIKKLIKLSLLLVILYICYRGFNYINSNNLTTITDELKYD